MEMDEQKMSRWGLLAGLAAVVLMVVGGALAGSPPKLTEARKINEYFNDNRDALRVGAYLAGIAGIFFLWFLGSLYGRLRSAEGGTGRLAVVAITGGVVAIGVFFVANAVNVTSALHTEGALSGYRLASVDARLHRIRVGGLRERHGGGALEHEPAPEGLAYAGEAIALLWTSPPGRSRPRTTRSSSGPSHSSRGRSGWPP